MATSKRCSWLPELVLSSNPWSEKTNTFQVAKNYFWQNGKKLRIAMHTRPLTSTARRPQEVAISWKNHNFLLSCVLCGETRHFRDKIWVCLQGPKHKGSFYDSVCLYWLGFPPPCVGLELGYLFLVLVGTKLFTNHIIMITKVNLSSTDDEEGGVHLVHLNRQIFCPHFSTHCFLSTKSESIC